MNTLQKFQNIVDKQSHTFAKVVDFDVGSDHLLPFDLTANNKELTAEILADTDLFSTWVVEKLAQDNARYGIGGYNEHRMIYARSSHFDAEEEARRLHLGIDIWGPALTPIYNFHDAKVHSFQFNDHFGDYGATIILQYQFEDLIVHALYGHLNLASLSGLTEGQFIPRGEQFASFGVAEENGHWPPHLHFQLIFDLQGKHGDYPGVCQFTKRAQYLQNCPDPDLILKTTFKL